MATGRLAFLDRLRARVDPEALGERQRTVVTERQGPLAGRRVVRGREAECRAYYAAQAPGAPRAA